MTSSCSIEPQTSAELLKEERRAHGRTEQEQRVDEGEINALVVEVAGEEDVHLAFPQAARSVGADLGGRLAVHGERRNTVLAEVRMP